MRKIAVIAAVFALTAAIAGGCGSSEKENSIKLILPDKSMRTIIILRKLSPTPAKYPRRGIKISKSPL